MSGGSIHVSKQLLQQECLYSQERVHQSPQ
jgi:hypothetical protein